MSPDFLTTRKSAYKKLLEMHFQARVGHLGGNLSCLDTLLVLFHNFIKKNDYLVLSKGHSAGALYIALWSIGLLDDSDLTTFHQDRTLLAGHPPANGIEKIPFATGSLGHGLSLASGLALGLSLKGINGRIFCVMSDGEWQEGSTWEALIFAAHNKLSNLTVLVDHNGLQGFGNTIEIASMNPLWEKIAGFNVETSIIDGHDPATIFSEVSAKSKSLRVIFLKTIKGKGISSLENKMESHYLHLSQDQLNTAIQDLENL
jgi:transketolase